MSKRAILYARVSTAHQADAWGLDAQFDAMRKYAALHGFTIITEISDEVSGTVSLRERSGGQQLYSYLDRKAVDVVIFHRLDRITRDEDLIEIHIARRDIRNANAELHFADGGKTDLSMWGSAIDHIKALGAAEERLKIKARSIGGRQAKAKSGAWVGQGEPPYGYNRDGHGKASKLVINEAEAAIVKRIFDLYTGNNGNPPVALKAICVLLTDEGVPVPSTTKPHPRIGRYWQKRLVQIILSRVIYIGKMQYGDIITDAPHLAIIDPAQFEAAQVLRNRNRYKERNSHRHHYLMTSRVFCACGRRMMGKNKAADYQYYMCSGNTLIKYARTCKEPYVRAKTLDSIVWDWLSGLLCDTTKLIAALEKIAAERISTLAPRRTRYEHLQTHIAKLEKSIGRNVSLYADSTEIELKILRDEVKRQSAALESCRAEAAILAHEIEQGEISQAEQAALVRSAAAYCELIKEADRETKKYCLQRLNVECHLSRNTDGQLMAKLTCNLTPPNTPDLLPLGRIYHPPSKRSSGQIRAIL